MRERIADSMAIAAAATARRPEVVCAHPISLQAHLVEAPLPNAYPQTPLDEGGSEG
ncbi:hypothetical protein [Jiangella muralis]|uniref:hypothetical protein n=1 Tax=Jiangella muralis TaxID=702383 RepID=UPI0012FA5EC3|nr:hypothetical protein [Jiangella muralis]